MGNGEAIKVHFIYLPKYKRHFRIILQYIEKLDINIVISFDGYGVSGHPNHSSCFQSLQFLYTNGLIPIDVQIFVLDSVQLWRKYMSFFDLFISYFASTFLLIASPCDIFCIYSAMWAHKSQLLWFRYLYMIFSRYVIVNSLKRISLQSRFYSRKSKWFLYLCSGSYARWSIWGTEAFPK